MNYLSIGKASFDTVLPTSQADDPRLLMIGLLVFSPQKIPQIERWLTVFLTDTS